MTMTAIPALDRTSPTFKTDVDTFFSSRIPTFVTEANALQADVLAKQLLAAGSAASASTDAGTATTQAGIATASAVTATTAPGTSAASTTSLTVALGSVSFTITTGKLYIPGQFVVVASTASPGNFMVGQITAHTSGTGAITVNVIQSGGSGTFASWNVGITASMTLANNIWTGQQTYQSIITETPVVANTSTNYTVPERSTHDLTLTGNWVPTFPALGAGKQFTLLLKQDATGSRTITWPSAVRWSAGVAPTITSVIGKTDVISFICDGTYWLGFVCAQNFTRA